MFSSLKREAVHCGIVSCGSVSHVQRLIYWFSDFSHPIRDIFKKKKKLFRGFFDLSLNVLPCSWVRRPWELTALQIAKTQKQLYQFANTQAQHKDTRKATTQQKWQRLANYYLVNVINLTKSICTQWQVLPCSTCVHLVVLLLFGARFLTLCLCRQIDEVVVFFSTCCFLYLQGCELSGPLYEWAVVCFSVSNHFCFKVNLLKPEV